jgi:putative membrane protein
VFFWALGRPCEDAAVSELEPGVEDATQRTYLAHERTLLAWWRTGLAAFAVAIAIGRLVPALLDAPATPFVILGTGYGLLGVAFVLLGAQRDRAVARQLASGRFEPLDGRVVVGVTLALVLFGLATILLLILES